MTFNWHFEGVLFNYFALNYSTGKADVCRSPVTETCWCGITCAHTITPSRVAVPGCLWRAVLGHSNFANCAWELFGKVLADQAKIVPGLF